MIQGTSGRKFGSAWFMLAFAVTLLTGGCRPRVVSEATLTIVVPKDFIGLIYVRQSISSQAQQIDPEDPEITLNASAKGEIYVSDRQIFSWRGTGERMERRLIGRNDDGTPLPLLDPMLEQKRAIGWADDMLKDRRASVMCIIRVAPTERHFRNKLRPKPEPVVSH